jgi:hypothetical protein
MRPSNSQRGLEAGQAHTAREWLETLEGGGKAVRKLEKQQK